MTCKILLLEKLKTTSPRQITFLNGLWDFRCEGEQEWTHLRVPGCYTDSRSGKWAKEYWDAYGRSRDWEGKAATYRRTLTITDEMLMRPLLFRIDGCYQVYRVLLNGTEVGAKSDGYTPLLCPLNGAAVRGENTLEVVVSSDNGPLHGGESTPSRGIWQDTFLISQAELAIRGNPAIRTQVSDGTIACVVEVTNDRSTDAHFSVKAIVADDTGEVVKVFEKDSLSVTAGKVANFELNTSWKDARHWYPHDPYLYTMHIVIEDAEGGVIDHWQDRFGFREITWKGPHLYLNGRELYLRGHGGHYLGDLQGTKEYLVTWFTELKKRGVNFMRLHIYPRHRDLYRAADEVGFMLMGEPAFHFKVPEATEADRAFACQHLGDMIDHLRNHPSIIMWSVSNELRWRGGGEKPWLVDHGRAKDSTRPAFSSDFSGFSTHGDLLGHHYSTDEVFSEWEEFGPDKPMIWDECGSVWQPTRPLDNGSAGYEMTSQDYATGMFRDGNDEILKAMDLIREGREFAGELHRVNAVVPWDLSYVFFRWQPYNNYRGIALEWADPTAPGTQPQQVLPCSSPLNVWDPSLPVLEPNPGFYLFEEDMKWVRFFGESKSRSFLAGDTVTLSTPLFFYDDLRLVDSVTCRVESMAGAVLSEHSQALDLVPGQMLREVSWTFVMPKADTATGIRLVREFSCQGRPGYRDEREGRLYPQVNELGNVAIYDPDNRLQGRFKSVEGSNVILALTDQLPEEMEAGIRAGRRVIQLLSKTAGYVSEGSAVKLLNGPVYTCLDGLGQEEFTFWRGGSIHGAMKRPGGNSCVILSGNRDGDTSALHEEYQGTGLKIVTSLRLAESLDAEPAALWLLKNLTESAAAYQPARKSVALYGNDTWLKLLADVGVQARTLDNLDDLAGVELLITDGTAKAEALLSFADAGGQVFVQDVTETSGYSQLELTEPFLNEQSHCVKAATSWTLRDTPKDGVEYYKDIVIPQPFEPNYDPLLAGIANIDLHWDSTPMFEHGLAHPEGKILISNWRIDWSVPPFGGEYINTGKDMRRANWFLNRNAVLLRKPHGTGQLIFSKLNFHTGGAKGRRVLCQLLTNLGVSLDEEGAHLPSGQGRFDRDIEVLQQKRLAAARACTSRLKAPGHLPEAVYDMSGTGSGKLPQTLLILDSGMKPYGKIISDNLMDFGLTTTAKVTFRSAKELALKLEEAVAGNRWDVIYFTLGRPLSDDEDKAAIDSIIERLKATGSQLMWGSTPPIPEALADEGGNEAILAFNGYVKDLIVDKDIYINDCHDYVTQHLADYLKGHEPLPSEADRHKFGEAIAKAIKFFGN
jgi:hypothetical protein